RRRSRQGAIRRITLEPIVTETHIRATAGDASTVLVNVVITYTYGRRRGIVDAGAVRGNPIGGCVDNGAGGNVDAVGRVAIYHRVADIGGTARRLQTIDIASQDHVVVGGVKRARSYGLTDAVT